MSDSSHDHSSHANPTEHPKIEHQSHEHPAKGPQDLMLINVKLASDIAYWSKEFDITGERLHEVIRTHGNHVGKIRSALQKRGA